jgi:hypothetical protein
VAECKYCYFVRLRTTYQQATAYECFFRIPIIPGEHQCHLFEREPGSDDDLGERPEIASKASESAYEARSGVYQSRSAS